MIKIYKIVDASASRLALTIHLTKCARLLRTSNGGAWRARKVLVRTTLIHGARGSRFHLTRCLRTLRARLQSSKIRCLFRHLWWPRARRALVRVSSRCGMCKAIARGRAHGSIDDTVCDGPCAHSNCKRGGLALHNAFLPNVVCSFEFGLLL